MSRSYPEPELSVVIPTRDRSSRLRATLQALVRESETVDVEVIVVDDGSTDDTPEVLERLTGELPYPLTPLQRAGGGPAAARNAGVAAAEARRILFLGDDTRPAAGCLRRHLDHAAGREVGVQGRVDWDPEEEITPLMHFLAPEGPQFFFRGLAEGQPVPFTTVLGSNLSAPRRWLLEEPFDEGFPHAAVEDTELAWRWRRRGWTTIWAPDARALHHHRYDDLDVFLERQRRAGRSARHALALHPHPVLAWRLLIQPVLFGLVVRTRRLLGRGRPTDDWDLASRRALLAGFFGFPSRQAAGG